MNVAADTIMVTDAIRRKPLRFSVIIPIYNRAQELRQLLDALGRQLFPLDRFEVVICDDGSTEDLASIAKEMAAEYGFRVVYLQQENRGPGAARNLGLAHACGEIVASTDSDCVPDLDWLAAFDRAFTDHEPGLAGGPVAYRGARYLSGRCVNFLMSSTVGAGRARDPRGPIAMKFYPRTGNLAVRRVLALKVGGFPGDACGEDLEFSHRISQRHGPPVFVPSASVLHDERSGLAVIFLENLRKGRARVRLRKTCRMHQPIHTLPMALVLMLMGSVLAALLWPSARLFVTMPWIVYTAALVVLAIQGAVALGELRAVAVIPCYAFLMHIGYGLGYLAASVGLTGKNGDSYVVDWNLLRHDTSPIIFGPSTSPGAIASDSPGRATAL